MSSHDTSQRQPAQAAHLLECPDPSLWTNTQKQPKQPWKNKAEGNIITKHLDFSARFMMLDLFHSCLLHFISFLDTSTG